MLKVLINLRMSRKLLTFKCHRTGRLTFAVRTKKVWRMDSLPFRHTPSKNANDYIFLKKYSVIELTSM